MKNVLLIALILFCSCFLKAQDYRKIDSLKTILNTTPPLNGTDADTARMQVCINIGQLYQSIKPDSAIWWYSSISDTIFNTERIKKNPNKTKTNANALRYIGNVANVRNNYSEAIFYYTHSLKIMEELGNKQGISKCLMNLGNLTYRQGNNSIANFYYERTLKIYEELGDKKGISGCLNNLGNVASDQGVYPDAIAYYERSLIMSEELGDKIGISKCLHNLGIIANYQGNYSIAISYYERTLKIDEELDNKQGISSCLNDIGIVEWNQGNYPNAISYYERSLKIDEELGDKKGISYCLNNLGNVACDQGNFSVGLSYFKRSLKISEELSDKRMISGCMNNLGVIAWNQGNYSSALFYYERSLKISEELGDKKTISNCLMNLGIIATDEGNYPLALSYHMRSMKIKEELNDKSGISISMNNIGAVAWNQGNYSLALSYYERSLNIYEELGDNSELALFYPQLAKAYIKNNEIEKAMPLFLKSHDITLNLLKDNFTILSEKDKELYLDKTKSVFNDLNSFNINYPKQNDSLSGLCYNNELILKGLLLKSTQNMLNAVYNSQDTALKNTYFLLKQYRNQISTLQGSEEKNRDSLIADFENKANNEERKLVKLSADFSNIQNLFNYKWEDVQKALKPGEAAIEFVSFNQGIKDDTTIYAALLITPINKKPLTIKLFDDYQLKKIIDVYKGDDFQKVSKLYGTNKNINNELYKLIWEPLEQQLAGITTVYYAPVGVLNKISFSALGKDNQLLCDKYNLQQVSTTGKLIKAESFSMESNLTAAVFGGIDYNPDSVKQELWKYLPGTLTEKDIIQKQLQKRKVAVTSYSGKEASEPAFKSLYTETCSKPNIVHIATHGFFYPDPEQVKKETVKKTEQGLVAFRGSSGCGVWQFVQNKNPMMRSGLVFAGANRVWSGEWGKIDDEGVLTAQEVSQLNMKNTSLVVLSACETGLGDIKGSEGVYGLQRAFKMAGVKYIVMSLWQVPDKETEEFMVTLYTKLLKLKDIRKSFNETQKEMRKKYDPYFWGAFVLIE